MEDSMQSIPSLRAARNRYSTNRLPKFPTGKLFWKGHRQEMPASHTLLVSKTGTASNLSCLMRNRPVTRALGQLLKWAIRLRPYPSVETFHARVRRRIRDWEPAFVRSRKCATERVVSAALLPNPD